MEVETIKYTPRGLSHDYIAVDRPTRAGKRLVRWGTGFHWARETTKMSKDVCAICGYGEGAGGRRGKHTAFPAIEAIADTLDR
jgi:hypothetical protein